MEIVVICESCGEAPGQPGLAGRCQRCEMRIQVARGELMRAANDLVLFDLQRLVGFAKGRGMCRDGKLAVRVNSTMEALGIADALPVNVTADQVWKAVSMSADGLVSGLELIVTTSS